jgi:hypothetical protein
MPSFRPNNAWQSRLNCMQVLRRDLTETVRDNFALVILIAVIAAIVSQGLDLL